MNTVTIESIKAKIIAEEYLISTSLKSTICVLTLENGFEVRGESGLVDPSMYDQVIAHRIAKERAMNNIWVLEGYLLQENLFQQSKNKNQ